LVDKEVMIFPYQPHWTDIKGSIKFVLLLKILLLN